MDLRSIESVGDKCRRRGVYEREFDNIPSLQNPDAWTVATHHASAGISGGECQRMCELRFSGLFGFTAPFKRKRTDWIEGELRPQTRD